ncbi:MAG: hypothetical protein HOE90_05420 [Bacteriovoracaceae bacterium]|jgi:hypothetical protein|nr:hypothetical protein [Bacteriovoracaceae bacterium]
MKILGLLCLLLATSAQASFNNYCNGAPKTHFKTPLYPNGKSVKNQFNNYFYPSGRKVRPYGKSYWPTGVRVINFDDVRYPNNQKLKNFGTVYYPNGNTAKKLGKCYNKNGKSIKCNQVVSVSGTIGHYNFGYYRKTMKYSGKLDLSNGTLRSFWSFVFYYDDYNMGLNVGLNGGAISGIKVACH